MSSYIVNQNSVQDALKRSLVAVDDTFPVYWIGQLSITEEQAKQTFSMVLASLANETEEAVQGDALYRAHAEMTWRIVGVVDPGEITRCRSVAAAVKDKWRTEVRKNEDIIFDSLSMVEEYSQTGRYVIDLVLNYNYYNEGSA